MLEVWYDSPYDGWQYVFSDGLEDIVKYFAEKFDDVDWNDWMVVDSLDISRFVEDERKRRTL